jgi:hypothetical protein
LRDGRRLVEAREALPAGAGHTIPTKTASSGLEQVVMLDVKLWRGQASLHAEDKGNAVSMGGGYA